jgi:hypothetical protein
MKKQDTTFIRLEYSILGIQGLTYTDKIVLAYNRSFDNAGGYFASNKHAAQTLFMNIKTFQKSVCKLKKLGLWKLRGEAIGIRQRPAGAGILPAGAGTIPTGGESHPPRVVRHPTGGDKISVVLPLKNDVLLDNLLDNRLDKDNKELLDNASEAANLPSGSLSIEELFMKTFYEGTSFKNTGSAYPTNSTNLDGRTVLANDSTYAVSTCSLVVPPKAEGARFLSDLDMVKQNLEAWRHGHAEPFTNQDIAAARNLVNYIKPEDGLRN